MRGGLVKPRKLSDEVAHHLEQMIRDGDFAESGRLPSERDLMRHFGVGRPSVREALLHLSKMGLVEVRSGERARVTSPTPRFVIDALAGTARHLLGAPGGVRDFQNARIFFEVLASEGQYHAGILNQQIEAVRAMRLCVNDRGRAVEA